MVDFKKLKTDLENKKQDRANRLINRENKKYQIKIVKGDLIKVAIGEGALVIANASNGLGVMGAGIALAIKIAGGSVIEDAAKSHIRSTYVRNAGDMFWTCSGVLAEHGIKHIAHIVTMRHWNDVLRGASGTVDDCRDALAKTLSELSEDLDTDNLSIAIPALGTGRGGLNKSDVAMMMVKESLKFPFIRIILVDRDEEMVKLWNTSLNLQRF